MKEITCVAAVCLLAAALFNVRSESFWLHKIEATKAAQDEESDEHVRRNIEKVYNDPPAIKETMDEWEDRMRKNREKSRFEQ